MMFEPNRPVQNSGQHVSRTPLRRTDTSTPFGYAAGPYPQQMQGGYGSPQVGMSPQQMQQYIASIRQDMHAEGMPINLPTDSYGGDASSAGAPPQKGFFRRYLPWLAGLAGLAAGAYGLKRWKDGHSHNVFEGINGQWKEQTAKDKKYFVSESDSKIGTEPRVRVWLRPLDDKMMKWYAIRYYYPTHDSNGNEVPYGKKEFEIYDGGKGDNHHPVLTWDDLPKEVQAHYAKQKDDSTAKAK